MNLSDRRLGANAVDSGLSAYTLAVPLLMFGVDACTVHRVPHAPQVGLHIRPELSDEQSDTWYRSGQPFAGALRSYGGTVRRWFNHMISVVPENALAAR